MKATTILFFIIALMYLSVISTVIGAFPPLSHDQLMTIASTLFMAALGVQFVLLAKKRSKKKIISDSIKTIVDHERCKEYFDLQTVRSLRNGGFFDSLLLDSPTLPAQSSRHLESEWYLKSE